MATMAGDGPIEGVEALLHRVAVDPTRRAQVYGFLGGFCHQCRNVLNSLKLTIYLASRDGPPGDPRLWAEQEGLYREVEQLYDRLQQICRPMAVRPVRLPIELLWDEAFPAWTELLARRGQRLDPGPPTEPVAVSFDPSRLRPALDAFVEWRARIAPRSQVMGLSWRAEGPDFLLDWEEAAPRRQPSRAERAATGAGAFALPFLARVVAAHGGTLACEAREPFRLRLRWPLDAVVPE